ncbi:hypothetical protein H0H92_005951 [Tricholoma furcatifolium]|nr:hypothetical protein H0H92_005951 [Tricholoma furcatifolium]
MAHIQHLLADTSSDSAQDRPVNGRAGLVASELTSAFSHPIRGPLLLKELGSPVVFEIKDWFVSFLQRDDTKGAWNDLINNDFCAQSAQQGDVLLPNFKWYMLQDMLYLRYYVYFKLGFYGTADWPTILNDFSLPSPVPSTYKGAPITRAVGYTQGALSDLKTKLDIPDATINSATPDPDALQPYINYLLSSARTEDYFTLWVITAPCVVGYETIANKYANSSIKDRLPKSNGNAESQFYRLFVSVNADPNNGQLKKYSTFLDAHVTPDSQAKYITHWVDLFNKSCAFERNFWNAALKHKI